MSKHPESPLVVVNGPVNGNAFAVIGAVSKALKRAGYKEEAEAYTAEALASPSYDALLTLSMEYANFDL